MATEVRTFEADPAAPAGAAGGTRRTGPTAARLVAPTALLAVVLFALPALLDSYWLQVMTGVVIYSIVTLGLGVLIGRVGMVSLCQFVLLGIGAWVALRLGYATDLPFPVLVLLAGLITGVIGTLIGLPALRLSGLYLALITLMAAGGITVVLFGSPSSRTAATGSSATRRRAAPRRGSRARHWRRATRPTTATASSSPR